MADSIFDMFDYVRRSTLKLVEGVSESDADKIPEGLNNNIRWNLGHVFSSQESFAFGFAGLRVETPAEYRSLFGLGSNPANWKGKLPSLDELLKLLAEQPNRIRQELEYRLDEEVAKPFAIPGLTLKTFRELITFMIYHEGMHVQNIKNIKKLNEKACI